MKFICKFIFYISLIHIICNNYTNDTNKIYNNSTNILYNKNMPNLHMNQSNSSDKRKNLILGIIGGYSLNKILPFFKSLIYANFKNCDVVMFVKDIKIKTIEYLESIGVYVYKIPEIYNNICLIKLRWKMYIDYLKRNKNKYKLIFSGDVRDIFFQKDIFEYYKNYEPFLGVAIEDGTLTCKYNSRWIIDYVGIEKYNIIKNERIICVGSIWGTYEIFLNFCKVFWNRMKQNPHAVEQGIANYMFTYEKLFKDFLIKSDNYGPVMTIGKTNINNIIYDSQTNILNFADEIAAVIHQYDRHQDVVQKVIKKYCPELYNPNEVKNGSLKNINQNINDSNIGNKLSNHISLFKTKSNIIDFFISLQIFTLVLIIKYLLFIKLQK